MYYGKTIISSTVSNKVCLGKLLIDTLKARNIAIFHILGAYMHVEIPKKKNMPMKFRDEFMNIICDVNKEYKKYIVKENRRKVLYVHILRTTYRCIESTLLWYELFLKTLKELGFKINPYNKYTINKIIHSHQYTIYWCVDDNKLLSKGSKVILMILKEI